MKTPPASRNSWSASSASSDSASEPGTCGTDAAELTAVELALRCAESGIARLLVTNTRRDGSLQGPDTELLAEVLEAGLPVLAAGGIASLDDLRAVKAIGCEGAIAGSALWLGRFTLAEALAAVA